MTELERIEYQIKSLQDEIESLRKKQKEYKLPTCFCYASIIDFLADPTCLYLIADGFNWESTPQGADYWENLFGGGRKLSDKDIIQLQKWCIMYLQEENKRK
jgi:hypothetical protein